VTEGAVKASKFFLLSLDLPQIPLFKEQHMLATLQQVPLMDLFRKYNGKEEDKGKRYRVIRLPQFLILHVRRFTKNEFFDEKNPTIVNFPIKNLDLTDLVGEPAHYDLTANVVHEGKPEGGTYRV